MHEVSAPGRSMSLRCARAVGVSSLAWAVTSPAHVLAGGATPGPAGGAGLVLFTAWPLVVVLGGRPSRARMVLVLLAAQGVMHCLMELLSQPAPGSAADSVLITGQHQGHTAVAAEHAAGSSVSLAHTPGDHGLDLVPTPAMISVHLVAALVLGLALAHGEGLLRSTLALLVVVLLPIAALARAVLAALRVTAASARERGRVRPARVAAARPNRHVLDVVGRCVARRGPPAIA